MEGIVAAKQIAEFEKQDQKPEGTKTVTVPENPAKFSEEKTAAKVHRIN